MFRNYLAAALRNLARNRAFAAINIVGLAVGFAAALLIALYVRDEYSYDKWIPEYQQVYLLTGTDRMPGRTPIESHQTPAELADALKLDFPSIQNVVRVMPEEISLRHGDIEANETIYWAEPGFFDVLPLSVIAGDLKSALSEPDGIVLTRRMAQKYFGRDAPIGETLEINREHPMRVAAVIEDLPSNTHLTTEIIGSGLAVYSSLAQRLAHPVLPPSWIESGWTYLKLAPGASATEIERELPSFLGRHMKSTLSVMSGQVFLGLTPISKVHLLHQENGTSAMKPTGDPAAVFYLAGIGALILAVAAINFVNLMTARATHRAVEVGVRKTAGATKPNLIVQFIGESVLYAGLAAALAVAINALILPSFGALLSEKIGIDFGAALAGEACGAIVMVGVLAGFYPAFLLSSFRPAAVLKGVVLQASGTGRLRQVLVVLQFAILIGLVAGTGIMYRQTVFAMNQGLRFDKDQILLIETSCRNSFPERVRTLPGVRAAACSDPSVINLGSNNSPFKRAGHDSTILSIHYTDFGYLDLYELRPLAGRFSSADHSAAGPAHIDFAKPGVLGVVVNESAVRRLGFSSADAAIGQSLAMENVQAFRGITFEIIGVVRDFSFGSIQSLIPPSMYVVAPNNFAWLTVSLTGKDIPETLRAIDALWKESGDPRPITRLFLDQEVQKFYLDITRQSQVFAIFAGVAVFIACLGLLGLASFIAEQRTKEIGIRKAMGASRADILRLLLWQFAKPVLWANLIAWPVAGYLMNRWLHGFAYHVDLDPLVFVGASAAALIIALATVAGHALLVARAKPVTALRYE